MATVGVQAPPEGARLLVLVHVTALDVGSL